MIALLLAANVAAFPLSAIEHDPKAPAEYLYMYQGHLTQIARREAWEVFAICSQMGAPSEFGCAQWTSDRSRCTIVYRADKPHVYWHEIAHCNGWDHE